MQIPNRDQEEAALILLLLPLFEEWERDLYRIGVIPWEAYRVRVEAILTQRLASVFLLAVLIFEGERQRAGSTFSFDVGSLASMAIIWGRERASLVANNLRNNVMAVWARMLGIGASEATAKAAFATALGRDAASTIASTEVTRATSAGNKQAAQIYQATTGLILAGVWIAETDASGNPDARVCRICRSLHEQPQDVWSLRYPGGPPAHPRCRCELQYS
jgi:hypothetical protein